MANLTCFTVEEVARRLNKSRATVYGYIRSGKLAAEDYGFGREVGRYEVSETELRRFMGK